jgi:hypothetical protein
MGVGRVSEWRKVTSQNPAATSDSLNQRPRIEQSGRAATMNADHHTIGGYFSRCPSAKITFNEFGECESVAVDWLRMVTDPGLPES